MKHLNHNSSQHPTSKHRNTTQKLCLARISEIEEVKDKREQIKYKELRRGSAKRIRKSKECDKLTKQISVLKGDIRQLELEIKINTKKQKNLSGAKAKR